MKLFSLLAVSLPLALAPTAGGAAWNSSGRGSVTTTFFASALRVTVSAPGTTYRIGTLVPITMRVTNDSTQLLVPIRWSCHQFAVLHVVRASRFVANSTQDLGPAVLIHAPQTCGTAIGWLHPHRTWVAQQEVLLLHPHLAAQLDFVRRQVDGPGTVDLRVFTPVLNFTLIRGSGK